MATNSASSNPWTGHAGAVTGAPRHSGWVTADTDLRNIQIGGEPAVSRSSGQSTVEVVVIAPLLLMCAWALVDLGGFAKQRIHVGQVAARVAQSHMRGTDIAGSVRASVSPRQRRDISARIHGDELVVRERTHSGLLAAVLPAHVSSTVIIDADEGAS